MNFLLDTNILLWVVQDKDRLSETCKELLNNKDNYLYSSIASEWEITIKINIGKLKLSISIQQFFDAVNELNILPLEITRKHLTEYEKLPLFHRDPFDRLLIAQAKAESLAIISSDISFKKYDIDVVLN